MNATMPLPPLRRKMESGSRESESVAENTESTLLEICRAMGEGEGLSQVLDSILRLMSRTLNAQEISVLLIDGSSDKLEMKASIGLPSEIVARGYISRRGSIAEWVIQNREPLLLHGSVANDRFASLDTTRRIRSSVCVPLLARGTVIGTMNLNRTAPGAGDYSPRDVERIQLLASQAAIYIHNTMLHEENVKRERLAAIGEAIAGITHCMKNVITGLEGGLYVCKLARETGETARMDGSLVILERSISRISRLTRDLLMVSRDRSPVREWISLGGVIGDVQGVVAAEAERKDVKIDVRIHPGAEELFADEQHMYRVLLNLIENALEVSPNGSSIEVSARTDGDAGLRDENGAPSSGSLIIEVRDHGPGIPAGIREKVFNPFFSTKGSRGTGLGLSVVRTLVEAHGGRISVVTAEGGPTTFRLQLPRYQRPE